MKNENKGLHGPAEFANIAIDRVLPRGCFPKATRYTRSSRVDQETGPCPCCQITTAERHLLKTRGTRDQNTDLSPARLAHAN